MSHTYENLKKRVSVKSPAKRCSELVPLVECIRSHVPIELVRELLQSGHRAAPVSRKSTKKANSEVGIPADSMYFYAGRVFPENKKNVTRAVVLYGGGFDADKESDDCFEAQVTVNNPGSMDSGARPFDSGSLCEKRQDKQLKLNWKEHCAGDDDEPSVKAYFDAHNISSLAEWREYFALFVEEYFSSPSDYWDGIPSKRIDGTEFTELDDWRNWAFETHSKWEVPVGLAGEMIVNAQLFRNLFHNQAGFAGGPALSPVIKEKCRFVERPSIVAEQDARKMGLS